MKRRLELLATYRRFKVTTPFSQRLNSFVEEWFEKHKDIFIFVDEDDFDGEDIEGTFEKHKQRYKETGKIHIWTGASDCTIFGEAEINHKFRAWHDFIHIQQNKGYDFIGETFVCEIQKSMLPLDWHLERELIQIEIVGQALYFMESGTFLNNQRDFTYHYMINPCVIRNTGI